MVTAELDATCVVLPESEYKLKAAVCFVPSAVNVEFTILLTVRVPLVELLLVVTVPVAELVPDVNTVTSDTDQYKVVLTGILLYVMVQVTV